MTQRFKPFFVHRQMGSDPINAVQRSMPKAFTAKVEPGSTARTLKVAVTFCAQKDEFVKAHGRSYVEQAAFTEINARHLPAWLAEQEEKLLLGNNWPNLYNYVLKYIV